MSFETGIIIVIAMLAGNAFFVGAEFGLVSARRSNIELKALNGSRAAKITLGAMEQVSLMLAGAQLGVTLCSLILGAVGEPLFAHAFQKPFHGLGISDFWLELVSLILALIVMVYTHVVIGEMVPKNLALTEPTRAALILVPPLFFVVKFTRPIVEALNAVANGSLSLLGFKPKQEIVSSFSRDEVAGFVKESHREGLLSQEEEHLLSGTLEFEEQTVQSVVLPMDQLVVAATQSTAGQVENLANTTGFSRFPLLNAQGHLKGYIHLKDLLQVPDNQIDQPLQPRYIRPLASITTETTLRNALEVMRESGAHIARVSDKQGQVIGVAMLEDVLEELIGAINDETQKN